MPEWPAWLLNPSHPDAPIDATEELQRLYIIRALAERVGREPGDLTPAELRDIAEELSGDMQLLAIIQGQAIEHADRLATVMEQSIMMQAEQIASTPYWAYHPDKHGSWQDFLRAHITRTNRKYVEWLCEVAIPWMKANGYQDIIRHVWNDDTIGKTKIMVDKVRSEFKQNGIISPADSGKPVSPELAQRLEAMLTDLANPEIDTASFEERHRRPLTAVRTTPAPIPAFEFIGLNRTFVVLVCDSEEQVAHARMALKASWELGTGRETWLRGLAGHLQPQNSE